MPLPGEPIAATVPRYPLLGPLPVDDTVDATLLTLAVLLAEEGADVLGELEGEDTDPTLDTELALDTPPGQPA